jgi:GNAT superfamily N-acetyltransferase
MPDGFMIRPATPEDAEADTNLLAAAYPMLLAPSYEAELLARALPLMTRANPALLRSGAYYLALSPAGEVVGCGGWTLQRPGAPEEPVDPALGHIRHFGTHPNGSRRGIARALMNGCAMEALAASVHRFECYATLSAEPFYRALGFDTVALISVRLSDDVAFPLKQPFLVQLFRSGQLFATGFASCFDAWRTQMRRVAQQTLASAARWGGCAR